MKKISSFRPDKPEKAMLSLLLAAVSAGILAGAIYQSAAGKMLSPLMYQYFVPPIGGAVFRHFLMCFLTAVAFLSAVFLSGLSVFGQPAGAALLAYRGFGIGSAVAFMYSRYGAHAVIPVLILILPAALASCAVAVLAVRELLRSSCRLLRYWLTGDIPDNSARLSRLYCVKFAVLVLLSLIITAAELALYSLCSGFLKL